MTRQYQHRRQEKRGGKVPQIRARARPMLQLAAKGLSADTAIVCGDTVEGDTPALVESTGMVFGIRKGDRRWVVGDAVAKAVKVGGFIVVEQTPPEPPPPKLTRLREGAPGSAPDLPGRLDQWPVGFTTCVRCNQNPAAPGEERCDDCLAEMAGETPLERALRLAGT